MTNAKALGAAIAVALSSGGVAQGSLVGQWISDNYTDGAGTWTDSSGKGNTGNGVGTGSLTTTAGAFNGHKSINFAGGDGAAAGGFFTVANNAAPQGTLGATGLTLVSVFRTSTPNTSVGGQFWQKAGMIGNEQAGAVTDWGLGMGASQVDMGVGQPDTTIIASGNQDDGATHVAIGTWDTSGAMTLYVDGVQVAQNLASPTAPRNATGFAGFALGASVAAQNNDLHIFNGQIAELRLYDDNTQDIAALTSTLRTTYVPEPATAGLLAAGGLGLLTRRRRRCPYSRVT
jgi:hypothetical protein